MIQAKTEVVNDAVKTCLRNVAMQVAAMDPKYVSGMKFLRIIWNMKKEILMAQAKEETPINRKISLKNDHRAFE